MLGITDNIPPNYKNKKFNSYALIKHSKTSKVLVRSSLFLLGFIVITLNLPWTQNIRAKGEVTSLSPEKRPQNINSTIPGKIEKWYVREGQKVEKGDTIIKISEIKNDYFDPNLVNQTKKQIDAKNKSIDSYTSKITALENQIVALRENKKQKTTQYSIYIKQAELKVLSDSMDLEASKVKFEIASNQLDRIQSLYEEGIKSLTELEAKKNKFREAQAKLMSSENKLKASRNKLTSSKAQLIGIINEYNEKISKAESNLYSAFGNVAKTQDELYQKEVKLKNYEIRKNNYYILAPQDGYITKAKVNGVGQIVKEGQAIVTIMPSEYDLAVEMYIRPMDLPLISIGQKVRFIFDGWPSIVFSGWPNSSYGTYGGKVVAVDNFISDNGKYRILVTEDPDDQPWPKALRPGGGANGMALLKTVAVWYEIWRNLNGFPPDFYKTDNYGKKIKNDDKNK